MIGRSALLVGATGLVGGHCLDLLLADEAYDHVRTLGRRGVERRDPKLEQHAVDFERPADYAPVASAEDVFCCLGTTIQAAGSRAAFRRVDFEYPLGVAEAAARNGAEQFLLVSSIGADPRSRFLYTRTKGELERAVAELPFAAVHIFRPSLLLGRRREHRAGERIAQALFAATSAVWVGPLRPYRGIEARAVARAMVAVAKRRASGAHVYASDEIALLAASGE
jgi:uncharacterized protein YbjT (DUF2867 family)